MRVGSVGRRQDAVDPSSGHPRAKSATLRHRGSVPVCYPVILACSESYNKSLNLFATILFAQNGSAKRAARLRQAIRNVKSAYR